MSFPLFSKESPDQQVSSTHASYDGTSLILEGNVELQHGLGNMSAEHASLQKKEFENDFPFSRIEMKENVILSFKNASELLCDVAELDFTILKGILSSYEGKKVSYKDFFLGETTPTRLMGKRFDIQMMKEELAFGYKICSALIQQAVQIEYGNDFILQSDEAVYQKTNPQEKTLCGTIKAYPISAESYCNLLYQGETIQAKYIHIDANNSLIQIDEPKGFLQSQLFGKQQTSPLFLKCKKLLWNHEKDTLLLQEKVELKERTLGTLYAEKELLLQLGTFSEKKSIQWIQIEGFSHITNRDESSDWQHELLCFGKLQVDGENHQIFFTSPEERAKRLCYKDPEVVLHAKKGHIEYAENCYKPLSITLQGDVTIQSVKDSGSRRLGLADRLTYSPETRTVILSAHPKKRVLFQDEEQNLTMSAQEIHLVRDSETGEIQAQGIGNVQFSFSSEENNLLKKWIVIPKEEIKYLEPK